MDAIFGVIAVIVFLLLSLAVFGGLLLLALLLVKYGAEGIIRWAKNV